MWDDELWDVYEDSMSQVNSKKTVVEKRVNTFLIGADPEFSLVGDAGVGVDASKWVTHTSSIGSEGPMLELRPTPSFTAYGLCENLRTMLLSNTLKKAAEKAKFRAGACVRYQGDEDYSSDEWDSPMGGHIHFDRKGWPEWMAKMEALGDSRYTRKPPFVGKLHTLTALLEHLDILPQKECLKRRKEGYGTLSDSFRTDNYGTNTFEYRKMCSWLFRPHIAFLCLTTAKLVAAHPEVAKAELGSVYSKMFSPSFTRLCNFVAKFSEKDNDAARLSELVLSQGLRKIQADPTENFLPYWQKWEPEEAKEALCGD